MITIIFSYRKQVKLIYNKYDKKTDNFYKKKQHIKKKIKL